ncbi:MAG: sugar O-acetyltransferase [Clostridiales bacterium]|nr:sugar O-acetyltransferase [Clostridiales bacterium]
MTEKEKMINGELYDPGDEVLTKDRTLCKDLCFDYNSLRPSEEAEGKEILKKLLGKTEEHFYITAPFYCDYGYNISLGNYFYSNHNLVILDCARVTIGDNVLIGPNCGIYTAAHPVKAEERLKGLEFAEPITIEDNVWIGGGVQILPGVTIGKNSVIGSGSVVTRSVPPDTMAAGNPCRPIKNYKNDN